MIQAQLRCAWITHIENPTAAITPQLRPARPAEYLFGYTVLLSERYA